MIRKTFSRVAGDTYIFPLITLLTVAVDTPGAFLMSLAGIHHLDGNRHKTVPPFTKG